MSMTDPASDPYDYLASGNYVAVYNMPGCLPEMEPATFDSAADAWDWLADELDRSLDDDHPTYSSAVVEGEEYVRVMRRYAQSSAYQDAPVLGSVHVPDGYVYSVDIAETEQPITNRGGRA